MRALGEQASEKDLYRLGCWLGARLAALGLTCNFAPVLDVDSNPLNPIIADRSFSSDPERVSQCALALIDGMQSQGIAACGKHFPGHGHTTADSHVSLPTVSKSIQELLATELVPFRACAKSHLAAMMVAHVVFPALDSTGVPATFSSRILVGLLRRELGFAGVLFSDDLEMGAIASHWSPESAVSQAVRAGCDVLLICRDAKLADQALVTLVRMAQRDESLRQRIQLSCSRFLRLRSHFGPRPAADVDELSRAFREDTDAVS
jgi:beta-N-acetylhexosaminidase